MLRRHQQLRSQVRRMLRHVQRSRNRPLPGAPVHYVTTGGVKAVWDVRVDSARDRIMTQRPYNATAETE
ncbi:hypothetical protein LTR60_001215 [Cryomyces antarcticus]|nr:hypothetical protein LTR60_001215 [Cryomyces antarcticus]